MTNYHGKGRNYPALLEAKWCWLLWLDLMRGCPFLSLDRMSNAKRVRYTDFQHLGIHMKSSNLVSWRLHAVDSNVSTTHVRPNSYLKVHTYRLFSTRSWTAEMHDRVEFGGNLRDKQKPPPPKTLMDTRETRVPCLEWLWKISHS